MTDKDLTPRVLAGLVLGEDPAKFLGFRIMPDRSVVVLDQVGRKFILSLAELDRESERVIAQRLHARGRALIQDLKDGAAKIPPLPSPATPKVRSVATSQTRAPIRSNPSGTSKPKPASKPKTRPS